MNVSKHFALGLTTLLMSGENLFASARTTPLFINASIRSSGCSLVDLSMVSSSCGARVFANRNYSYAKNPHQDVSKEVRGIDDLRSQLLQTNKLLEKLKKEFENLSSGNRQLRSSNSDTKIDESSFSQMLPASFEKVDQFKVKNQDNQADFSSPGVKEDSGYQYNLKNINNMRNDYINRIINASKTPHEMNKETLSLILDVFSALPHRPETGIAKVLSGQVDTGKSLIYADVLAYIRDKGGDLSVYRNIYNQQNLSFDMDFCQVIELAAKEMMRDQNQKDLFADLEISLGNLSLQKSIDLIVTASHPLYLIMPEEINAIRELYLALSHRLETGVSRVLSGQIDTGKSKIYSEVLAYIKDKGGDLSVYRNVYARLMRSKIKNVLQILCAKTDAKQNTEINPPRAMTGASQINASLDVDESIQPAYYSLIRNLDCDNRDRDDDLKNDSQPILREMLSPEEILQKETQRLLRVYELLPEYHGKSITAILSKDAHNEKLPAWNAVMWAIDKIQKEALEKGEKAKIDLDYFKRLYSKLVTPSSGKGLNIGTNAYKISQKEIDRLNQIYHLIPEFAAKSITAVLSTDFHNEKLPAWNAVIGAIDKIQKEALAKGEKTKIDLDYFRKLHWSSVRVFGKGGGRKDP